MGDVSHTNPYTGETAGRLFNRGSTVVADGGEPRATRRTSEDRGSSNAADSQPAATDPVDSTASEQMKDVSHTPPNGAEDANEVFERGREHDRESERGVGDV